MPMAGAGGDLTTTVATAPTGTILVTAIGVIIIAITTTNDDRERSRSIRAPLPVSGPYPVIASFSWMSALPPKADMCRAQAHVCFGPRADVAMQERMSAMNGSADQSLGAHRDRKLKERAVWPASCGPQASTVGFYDRTGDR